MSKCLCMLEELQNREDQCLTNLMYLLYHCLDFCNHFSALCDRRHHSKIPVNKATFCALGCKAFHRCVGYVSKPPHISVTKGSQVLQMNPEFSDIIYWRMKKTILNNTKYHLGKIFPFTFCMFLCKDQFNEWEARNHQLKTWRYGNQLSEIGGKVRFAWQVCGEA